MVGWIVAAVLWGIGTGSVIAAAFSLNRRKRPLWEIALLAGFWWLSSFMLIVGTIRNADARGSVFRDWRVRSRRSLDGMDDEMVRRN